MFVCVGEKDINEHESEIFWETVIQIGKKERVMWWDEWKDIDWAWKKCKFVCVCESDCAFVCVCMRERNREWSKYIIRGNFGSLKRTFFLLFSNRSWSNKVVCVLRRNFTPYFAQLLVFISFLFLLYASFLLLTGIRICNTHYWEGHNDRFWYLENGVTIFWSTNQFNHSKIYSQTRKLTK